MANITLDGRGVTCADGATLLEVCKDNGVYVSSLCYIDGLPPYAGCRMCLVEVEGQRGLQLSCTTKVTDGMVVKSATSPEVGQTRKAVLSLILANHSDRCLTCHRREHCHPGDICLRDDVVTHRCVTCPKNYRCELQATCEVVGMSKYEPWEGEARSFYNTPEYPPADRANPFLEFDPKMCIICTRCVRACDELRHTGAITLAGRGFSTRIAFGAGGRIDESNCDYCGACIDVCPTATLLEHPHKWISRPDEWVETVCSYCSVGCTIKLAVKDGRGVMVRPSTVNPVSHDQICARGRFGYDALKAKEYLTRPLVRRGDLMAPVEWDTALDGVTTRLASIITQHGPGAVGFLAGPLLVNEEAYTVQKIARAVVGTNNIDFTGGAVARAVGGAITGGFGTEVLPADLTRLRKATHIVVVGDDLEAAHPVASLRVKDAVAYNNAKLVYVSSRWGELVDFVYGSTWLRPAPGGDAATLAALTRGLLTQEDVRLGLTRAGVGGVQALAGGLATENQDEAFRASLAVLREAWEKGADATVAVVVVPTHVNAWANADTARAAANLAITVCGPERAPSSFFMMPTDVNVLGLRDLGIAPDLLPGYHPPSDAPYRASLESAWGAQLSAESGLTFGQMMQAARDGSLKALVVVGDNPLLTAPDKAGVRAALESLDLLVVLDSVMTDTADLASIVLPDVDVYGKGGTYTPADRRVLRREAATGRLGSARPALETLAELGVRLGAAVGRGATFSDDPEAVMDEIAALVPLYAGSRYPNLITGDRQQEFDGSVPTKALQAGAAAAQEPMDALGLALLTGRTMYTSIEAAALHKPDADKLHREEFVEISFEDAQTLGVEDGDDVTLVSDQGEMRITARVTEDAPTGSVFVPLLFNGGAVTSLLSAEDGAAAPRVRVRVPQRV